MSQPFFLGIDPGMNKSAPGAWAIISEDLQVAQAWCWPIEGIPAVSKHVKNLNESYAIKLCVIELQRAAPRAGVTNAGKVQRNFGQWEGLVSGLSIPYQIHDPKKWQKSVLDSLRAGGDTKKESTSFAMRQFPHVDLSLKKYQGKADALNIALYARRIFLAT